MAHFKPFNTMANCAWIFEEFPIALSNCHKWNMNKCTQAIGIVNNWTHHNEETKNLFIRSNINHRFYLTNIETHCNTSIGIRYIFFLFSCYCFLFSNFARLFDSLTKRIGKSNDSITSRSAGFAIPFGSMRKLRAISICVQHQSRQQSKSNGHIHAANWTLKLHSSWERCVPDARFRGVYPIFYICILVFIATACPTVRPDATRVSHTAAVETWPTFLHLCAD